MAQLLIDWARTGNLLADIRTELDRQLTQYARPPQPSSCDGRYGLVPAQREPAARSNLCLNGSLFCALDDLHRSPGTGTA
ncbi:hypothetical protein [Streptomyces sp. NPDC006333]|uniref:hypothetical protein n=1 Tax=Streptomyces sp. NPDC006333 TaxID=3156753 RepID=UPI0033BC6B1B